MSSEIAREARALARDNAEDAIVRAIHMRVPDADVEGAYCLADAIKTELAAWFRQRSSPALHGDPFILASEWAARLIEEFAP